MGAAAAPGGSQSPATNRAGIMSIVSLTLFPAIAWSTISLAALIAAGELFVAARPIHCLRTRLWARCDSARKHQTGDQGALLLLGTHPARGHSAAQQAACASAPMPCQPCSKHCARRLRCNNLSQE